MPCAGRSSSRRVGCRDRHRRDRRLRRGGAVDGRRRVRLGQSQRDAERADIRLEQRELLSDPQGELIELAKIYERRGLALELASEVADALSRKGALKAHVRDELGLDEQRLARPFQAAWTLALSFTAGAALSLVAVAMLQQPLRIGGTAGR